MLGFESRRGPRIPILWIMKIQIPLCRTKKIQFHFEVTKEIAESIVQLKRSCQKQSSSYHHL